MRRLALAQRVAWAAAALAIDALPSPAGAHDAYGAWVQNGNGVSCCHDQDCRPTSFCALPGGGEGIELNGACIPIPYAKVIPDQPVDGRPHICAHAVAGMPETVLCVALPLGT